MSLQTSQREGGALPEGPADFGPPLLRLYRALTPVPPPAKLLALAAQQLAQAIPVERALLLAVDPQGKRVVEGATWHDGESHRLPLDPQPEVLTMGPLQDALAGVPVLLPETHQDPAWQRLGPAWQPLQSALWVPLGRRGQAMGVALLARRAARAFRPAELSLASALGAALGDLLHTSLALQEYRERAEFGRLLAAGVAPLAYTLEPQEVVERILTQVERVLRAEVVLFFLRTTQPDALELRAGTGQGIAVAQGAVFPATAGWLAQVAQSRETLWLPDLGLPPQAYGAFFRQAEVTVKGGFGVPIWAADQLLGLLLILNPRRVGLVTHIREMLDALATVAGVILKHARLFAELQQAHEEYRTLFNDTLDWIFITDLRGHIVEANQSAKEALGFTWEEMRAGRVPITRIHTPDPEALPEDLEQIPLDPPVRYEAEVTPKNRDPVPVQVYVRRVTVGGKPRIQWILRDISEAKQLETLREDLLTMIYHDLRSPLANIVSGLDVLESMGAAEGPAQTVVDIIRRGANRIQRLTSTLLDIRRLEAGQPLANMIPIAPRRLVEEALHDVRPMAEARKHQLEEVWPSEPLPRVLADPEMIQRVLINLLENAIKYTPEGGRIRIGARLAGPSQVRFWVQDTGPGIPPEEQARLFEKYVRASTAKTAKGLGLGLAYCRLAVEAHGGEIGVSSRPGQGATFYFTLPVADDETATGPYPV